MTAWAGLTGRSIIAGWDGAGSGESVRAVDPASGVELDPGFEFVTEAAVDAAAVAAGAAFDVYRETAPAERAAFLERIAAELDDRREAIVDRACAESGLPRARIEGEHGRTTGQIRLFAREVRLGSHQGVRIDEAQPDRAPLPAPDVRQRHIGVGPVAVFGPSNFPLAFSATGGDVASALAAGCPVIVKAHNAHPGTAELAGSAVAAAVEACGLPGGVYSLLFGAGRVVGQALAAHPAIKAIAFTGVAGGRHLADGHRGGETRADPGVRRDVEHQPPGGAGRGRGRRPGGVRGRLCGVADAGGGPVLHQPGAAVRAPRRPNRWSRPSPRRWPPRPAR